MAVACQVFLCIVHNNRDEKAVNEWGSVHVFLSGIKIVWGAVGACSSLLEHSLCVDVQGHDMCEQERSVKKGECDKQGRWKAGKGGFNERCRKRIEPLKVFMSVNVHPEPSVCSLVRVFRPLISTPSAPSHSLVACCGGVVQGGVWVHT